MKTRDTHVSIERDSHVSIEEFTKTKMFQMEYRVMFFFTFVFSILLSNFKLSKWLKTVML